MTMIAKSGVREARKDRQLTDLRKRVSEVDWWSTIHLDHDVVPSGTGSPGSRLALLRMPEDLTGKTVLDIGTGEGLFAFEAKRRGARQVVALDGQQHPGFAVTKDALGLDVDFLCLDPGEVSQERLGSFDLVLFLNVLHRVPDPMATLEHVFSMTGDRLILQTETALHGAGAPAAELRAMPKSYGRNGQSWWVPNPAAVLHMLAAVGFDGCEIVQQPHSSRGRRRGRIGRLLDWIPRQRKPLTNYLIAHAWRD